METKAKYTLVGFFVLSFSIAMVIFILWLARYDVNEQSFKEYRLYMTKSIAGLNINSIVYYKGLDVGLVKDIRINPKNQEEIEIILKISQPNLIKEDSYASIESQGITGNKTVELSGGSQNAKQLASNDNGFAVIPLKESFMSELTSQASNIGQKFDILLARLNMMLNNQNLHNIEKILDNTQHSTEKFNALMTALNETVNKNVNTTLYNVNHSLKQFDKLANNWDEVGSNINGLIKNDIKQLLQEFKGAANSAQNIDEVIEEFEYTLEKLNQTLEHFNDSGGDLLFKTREIQYGPGEKNE